MLQHVYMLANMIQKERREGREKIEGNARETKGNSRS